MDSDDEHAELCYLLSSLSACDPMAVARCAAALRAGRCTAAGCAPDHDGTHPSSCCGAEWVCAAALRACADAVRPHYMCGRCPSTACSDCRGAICTRCRPLDATWAPLCWPCRQRRSSERRAREKAERYAAWCAALRLGAQLVQRARIDLPAP